MLSALATAATDADAQVSLASLEAWGGHTPLLHPPLRERENRLVLKAARTGPITAKAVEETYRTLGVDLAALASGALPELPRVTFAAVPGDLSALSDSKQRKRVFVGVLLPAVLAVNDALRQERARLLAIAAQGATTPEDDLWLQELAARYGTAPDATALLERVDIIPIPIALAQAALESGWGQSRFARAGNAVFGKRTVSADRGIRPAEAGDCKGVYIERFSHLVDAVASYAFILNSGGKFKAFRKARAMMRRSGQAFNAALLVPTLAEYSERGNDYTKDVMTILTANRMQALSKVRFASAKSFASPGADLLRTAHEIRLPGVELVSAVSPFGHPRGRSSRILDDQIAQAGSGPMRPLRRTSLGRGGVDEADPPSATRSCRTARGRDDVGEPAAWRRPGGVGDNRRDSCSGLQGARRPGPRHAPDRARGRPRPVQVVGGGSR